MGRTTIDFGIDLGTTNSAIAVWDGQRRQVEVLRSKSGEEYIPSAVRIDKKGSLVVGRPAKDYYFFDPENTDVEFKLRMGTQNEKHFKDSGRRMKPEELSAEVLKALRQIARERLGEQEGVEAAVIGIPADFNRNAEEATKQAGALAGLREVRIIHEPIAAGMAYGLEHEGEDALWLVYDFGGGTFDAALIRLQDGQLQIAGHAGDKHLGGKNIDWDIVDRLLVPEVVRQHRPADFHRGNPKWISAFAKLKMSAEAAKIALSTWDSYELVIDLLYTDPKGKAVGFEMELHRSQIEQIAEPHILKTINICRRLLAEHHLDPQAIAKVILVGGPTLMPYLRERLQDHQTGLGIPLEFRVDPMTVVARGLAIMASTFPYSPVSQLSAGVMRVHLEYKPVGTEARCPVGGRVEDPAGGTLEGYTIEFINTNSVQGWRSGRIRLGEDGQFFVVLYADSNGQNTYQIELCDPHGNPIPCEPNMISYRTEKWIAGEEILTHSIGVGLAGGGIATFLPRGTSLPARKTMALTTVRPLSAGSSGSVLRVPVIEGEHSKADRNRLVGSLEIIGTEVERDLPRDSELEVTLEIRKDRTIQMTAYVPLLNKCFDVELTLKSEEPELARLQEEFHMERRRFEKASADARRLEVVEGLRIVRQIEDERRIPELERCLASAGTDPQALYQARDLLADLRSLIDQIEEALKEARLIDDAEYLISQIDKILNGQFPAPVSSSERSELAAAKDLLLVAKQQRNLSLLEMRLEATWSIYLTICEKDPNYWRAKYMYLAEIEEKDPKRIKDGQQYRHWKKKGKEGFHTGQIDTLKAACRGMAQALHRDGPGPISDVEWIR